MALGRVFEAITDLGMFFIMLFAGIEMQPSKIFEYSKQSMAVAVGVGKNVRGAVELVIADIALEAGILYLAGVVSPILANLFSAVVIMAIITTVARPVLLKQIYTKME